MCMIMCYYYPYHYTSNPTASTISAQYSWTMCVLLLGNVDPSKLERLDKLCDLMGRELMIIRFSVNDTNLP